jgi:hypothetical protein
MIAHDEDSEEAKSNSHATYPALDIAEPQHVIAGPPETSAYGGFLRFLDFQVKGGSYKACVLVTGDDALQELQSIRL